MSGTYYNPGTGVDDQAQGEAGRQLGTWIGHLLGGKGTAWPSAQDNAASSGGSFPVGAGQQPGSFDVFGWLANMLGQGTQQTLLNDVTSGRYRPQALSEGLGGGAGGGAPLAIGTGAGLGGQQTVPNPVGQRGPLGGGAPLAVGTGAGLGGQQTIPNPVTLSAAAPPASPPPGTGGPNVAPATSTPNTGSMWSDLGGFSSKINPANWGDLTQHPAQLVRLWMQQQGINPNSDNPLVQNMLREAQGAIGAFDLMNRTGQNGGAQPNPDAYLDFFDQYMKNPIQYSAEQGKQLLQKALQMGQQGDAFWSGRLGLPGAQGIDPVTGVDYSGQDSTTTDKANLLNNLLIQAFGSVLDPVTLQALTGQTKRAAEQYQLNAYDTTAQGPDALKSPTESFFDWLMRTGNAPLGASGQ
jgi:hypothetical protein